MGVYPVCLDLGGRRCLVIGGGPVAEGRVKSLLDAGAQVTVVSPRLTLALKRLADENRLTHIPRGYRRGDLAGAFLAIGATDDRAINEQAWQEAVERKILVNVVDDPSRCTFILPSIVRRGDLTIAISTNGKAPALAVRLRQQLERTIGYEYARFLELVGAMRASLAARYSDSEQRKALWYRLVDSDVLNRLRQGDEAGARRRIAEIMGITPIEPHRHAGRR